jgi:BolA protein
MNALNRTAIIKQRLQDALHPQHLVVTDDSEDHVGHAGAQAGGGHFSVEIVAEAFQQKSLPERHRLVYQALGDMMDAEIHALRIRAKSPQE